MEKQKKLIDLDNLQNTTWPSFTEYLTKPPPKVSSLCEVGEDIVLAAMSSNFQLMAVIQEKNDSRKLFVIDFTKKKYFFIWEFSSSINAIKFEVGYDNRLIVASQDGKIYFIDIIEGEMQTFEDHAAIPIGIECNNNSDMIVTWSKKDALIWPTPVESLKSKLNVNSDENIVWVCHLWNKSCFVAGFDSGTVMIWDELNDINEYAIMSKEDDRKFNSYTVSCDGELIVGGGSLPHLVIYSISSKIILRKLMISHLCPTLVFCQFMPSIHAHFTKVLLLNSAEGTVIMFDLEKCEKIKSLRSQNYLIRDICVNYEGQLIAITYDNGHTKLYPTLSFFPSVEAERTKSRSDAPVSVGDERKKIQSGLTQLKESNFHASNSTSHMQSGNKFDERSERRLEVLLDKSKWLQILDEFKEFPEKYRRIIWTSILELPLNSLVVAGLSRKEQHPAVEGFQNYIHEDDAHISEYLTSTLSCLLHWSPCLACANFLVDLIRNFVLIFKDYSIHCFELCATVIFNWCRTWFESWPDPPISIMHIIEQIICDNDPELLVHLMKLKIGPEIYSWSILSTGFSKVVSSRDHLILWDNILAKPPSYIICLVASFSLCLKKSILSCSSHSEAKQLYEQESWLLPALLLRKAQEIHIKLKINEKHLNLLDRMEYIPKGGLTPFNFEIHNKTISENASDVDLNKRDLKLYEIVENQLQPRVPLTPLCGSNSYEDCLKKISSLRKKQVRRHAL